MNFAARPISFLDLADLKDQVGRPRARPHASDKARAATER
jgi:hypothetical protein